MVQWNTYLDCKTLLPAQYESTAASVGKRYGKIAVLNIAVLSFGGKYLSLKQIKWSKNNEVRHCSGGTASIFFAL